MEEWLGRKIKEINTSQNSYEPLNVVWTSLLQILKSEAGTPPEIILETHLTKIIDSLTRKHVSIHTGKYNELLTYVENALLYLRTLNRKNTVTNPTVS